MDTYYLEITVSAVLFGCEVYTNTTAQYVDNITLMISCINRNKQTKEDVVNMHNIRISYKLTVNTDKYMRR